MHFAGVRQTLNSADRVGQYVIFNIAQNKARLISIINYRDQRVIVMKILEHARYDRENLAK